MGYSTVRIDNEKALELIANGAGEVVSASKDKYFEPESDWRTLLKHTDIKDDGSTIFFSLATGCFVEVDLFVPVDINSLIASGLIS